MIFCVVSLSRSQRPCLVSAMLLIRMVGSSSHASFAAFFWLITLCSLLGSCEGEWAGWALPRKTYWFTDIKFYYPLHNMTCFCHSGNHHQPSPLAVRLLLSDVLRTIRLPHALQHSSIDRPHRPPPAAGRNSSHLASNIASLRFPRCSK